MSYHLDIVGGTPLKGTVRVGGAKNAVLPMMIASLLTADPVVLENVPNIHDVSVAGHLLETFGADIDYREDTLRISVPSLVATEAPYNLVKALRASFWVLGPVLARGGAARVALPGGDILGARPVDMHIDALVRMGATVKTSHGVVYATAVNGLSPAVHEFRFPSVGATHQVLMAAALTPGVTEIKGAAKEPEVVALANMLTLMGAKVTGAGTSHIKIYGQSTLGGAHVNVIGDRLEASTYLLAGVATGGAVTVEGIDPIFLGKPLEVMKRMGVSIYTTSDSITATLNGPLKGTTIATGPFPLFATDLQPLFMAALTLANGESVIEENIFNGRFGYVSELCRMGAHITVDGKTATVRGVDTLSGARVDGMDIRAAAALLISALAAEGTSSIHEIQHLRRGYESLERKLKSLGAQVSLTMSDPEDYLYAGC